MNVIVINGPMGIGKTTVGTYTGIWQSTISSVKTDLFSK